MAEYLYIRSLVSGKYDINNPDRVDGGSNQIYLAKEVESALPGKMFKLICNDSEAKFVFNNTLSGAEETTLSTTVSDHQNNV